MVAVQIIDAGSSKEQPKYASAVEQERSHKDVVIGKEKSHCWMVVVGVDCFYCGDGNCYHLFGFGFKNYQGEIPPPQVKLEVPTWRNKGDEA